MTPTEIASEIAHEGKKTLASQKVFRPHRNRSARRRMVGIIAFIVAVSAGLGLTAGIILAFTTR